MTPELGVIASAESLAFVLTEAIATNTCNWIHRPFYEVGKIQGF